MLFLSPKKFWYKTSSLHDFLRC